MYLRLQHFKNVLPLSRNLKNYKKIILINDNMKAFVFFLKKIGCN